MRRRALGLVFAAAVLPARAQLSVPEAETTAACDLYPEVTCTSTDAGMNADILQLAVEVREELAPVLNLRGAWRFPVRVVILTPDDPRSAKTPDETVTVDAIDNTMRIDATTSSTDPNLKSFVQRQFVTALLWEKFFVAMKSFDTNTRLDLVPVWLIEGLNEWIDRDSGRDREAIVLRAAQAQRAPSLSDVISWQEISSDRLLGLYQRAFCYYLVSSLITEGPKRDDFQQWLTTVGKTGPSSGKLLLPTETGWQRQLLLAPEGARDLVYTWEESSAGLAALDPIDLPKKEAGDRACTLDNVTGFKPDPALTDAVRKRIFDLTALELRAHPGWRPILELYRFGLSALVNGQSASAQKLIAQARQKRNDEMAYHQKLQDYMNWFEVTKDYAGQDSAFRSYFSTAQEMERAEGDPDHPNPIRADVLHVESQL